MKILDHPPIQYMLAFWNSIQLRCNLLLESFWLETSSKRTWRIFLYPYFKHILQAHSTICNSSVHTIPSYIASISIWENNPESIIWYCIFFWVREALELQLKSLIFLFFFYKQGILSSLLHTEHIHSDAIEIPI